MLVIKSKNERISETIQIIVDRVIEFMDKPNEFKTSLDYDQDNEKTTLTITNVATSKKFHVIIKFGE